MTHFLSLFFMTFLCKDISVEGRVVVVTYATSTEQYEAGVVVDGGYYHKYMSKEPLQQGDVVIIKQISCK